MIDSTEDWGKIWKEICVFQNLCFQNDTRN